MSCTSSRCRCLGRGTPHAQHHDTLWAWHGRGIRPCQAPLQQCGTWAPCSPSPVLTPPLTNEITTPNGYFHHGRATSPRPTTSFLGGKRFPAPRVSSTVDGHRGPGRTPAGLAETKTNLN